MECEASPHSSVNRELSLDSEIQSCLSGASWRESVRTLSSQRPKKAKKAAGEPELETLWRTMREAQKELTKGLANLSLGGS
jgi:hypothetical protein